MNKRLGSPRIFSYICRQNSDIVALHDIVGNTERYACLTVVKPRNLSHVNPDDSVISPMHCVDCYYCILDYGFFLGPSTGDMERNSVTLFNFYAKYNITIQNET